MNITFENEIGKVRMDGGTGCQDWKITEISGLGLPEKTFQTVVYPNQPGQKTVHISEEARTITISGDINASGLTLTKLLSKAVKVFHRPGALFLQDRVKKRKINAVCSAFELGERNNAYQLFTLQFVCDSPYFEDPEPTKTDVFYREDLLKDTFELPGVFSVRHAAKKIFNGGDMKTEPVLTVQGGTGTVQPQEKTGIMIKNNTTGQTIVLDYQLKEGETVTIDIPARKITNNTGKNLLGTITNDTFLNDFWLETGNNLLEVTSGNLWVNVSCEHAGRYLEAVY